MDRAVLRFDLGVPLSAGPVPPGVPPVAFFAAFQQALALPVVGTGFDP
jgi:hypothetical protein